jgi:PAS domain S-box-containing protein
VNRESSKKLAQAFELDSTAELESLATRLRTGGEVDAATLRRGVLALLDGAREQSAPHAISDQRLRIALESSELGLWEWNIATGDVRVDRTYRELVGLGSSAEVWPITEFARLVPPDELCAFMVQVRDVLRGAAPVLQIEHRVLHADGRWVWLETYGCITERDANGRALRMTGTHTNITDRKQLQRALSNALRVMHALLETLPLPVVIRDAERRVTMVNAAWEQMMSVSRAQVVGHRIDELTNRPAPAGHHESDHLALTEKSPQRYETLVHAQDARIYNVIIAKTPLLAEDGSVTGIASVLTDISEQKRIAGALDRAREAAEAAVQVKSRFLANMSHELRTPLNGVVGMASLLENTALDAKQRRFVRTLKSSAEALITLINDVLDLSKAEAGKLDLVVTPLDLRREIEQVVALFGARAHAKGIELAAHVAPGVPATIQGDSLRLRQVLGNLVNNAVKFTETGAVLLAVTRVDEPGAPGLEFAVTDTGIGVDPAEQRRIFEPFEQADGSVTRKFGGTGLGLAISRQLIELMDGTMELESELERGSRFSFRIPRAVPHADSPRGEPADGVAVFLIGLHPLIRAAARELLELQSAHVLCFDSPAEASEAMREIPAGVQRLRVIIDSSATSKLEQTATALRAAAGPRAIELIALLPPDADTTPPAGVNRCLMKPLVTADLLAAELVATDLAAPSPIDTAMSTRLRVLPMHGSRGRALVVEDNAVNQEMARAMLDMLGFQVLTASNGQEGVITAAQNPDLVLILMDCQMPVMDGLAAARAIRAAEPSGSRVPIVALTGNAMPGDREACVASGMDDYLAKPFSLKALRTLIDRWVGAQPPTEAHAV